jgi:hypothetical protein
LRSLPELSIDADELDAQLEELFDDRVLSEAHGMRKQALSPQRRNGADDKRLMLCRARQKERSRLAEDRAFLLDDNHLTSLSPQQLRESLAYLKEEKSQAESIELDLREAQLRSQKREEEKKNIGKKRLR